MVNFSTAFTLKFQTSSVLEETRSACSNQNSMDTQSQERESRSTISQWCCLEYQWNFWNRAIFRLNLFLNFKADLAGSGHCKVISTSHCYRGHMIKKLILHVKCQSAYLFLHQLMYCTPQSPLPTHTPSHVHSYRSFAGSFSDFTFLTRLALTYEEYI